MLKDEMITINKQILYSIKDIMCIAHQMLKNEDGVEDAKTILVRGVFSLDMALEEKGEASEKDNG